MERVEQEALLGDRLRGDLYPHSPFHRGRLDRAGFGRRDFRKISDLVRLAPMFLDDVPDSRTLLIDQSSRHFRRFKYFQRFRPAAWLQTGKRVFAYSAEDLLLLAELGKRGLAAAGLTTNDVIADVAMHCGSRDHWQLLLGARKARITVDEVENGAKPERVRASAPTVVAGEPDELLRILRTVNLQEQLPYVHTLLCLGLAPPEHVAALTEQLPPKARLVQWWAPAGVLGAWAQCRGGIGFHTWPDTEIVEVVDPISGLPSPDGAIGELVWTGLGWHATAMLRLATATPVRARHRRCTACGRTTLRVGPVVSAPGFPAVLSGHPNIRNWVGELNHHANSDELTLWIALSNPDDSLQLLEDLAEQVGLASVRIVDVDEVDRRLESANGERFADRRAFSDESK